MSRGRVTRPLGENTGRAWACPLGTASATRVLASSCRCGLALARSLGHEGQGLNFL